MERKKPAYEKPTARIVGRETDEYREIMELLNLNKDEERISNDPEKGTEDSRIPKEP